MKKIILKLGLILFLISNYCLSQQGNSQIEIKYTRPPLNTLRADDLWKFTLKNKSNQDLEFSLSGTLSEKKAGLIATGQTMSIKLNKGETRQFKVSDLPKTPDISYVHSDSRFKEALMRAGNLPNGDYTICITAKQKSTNEEIGNECLEQEILKEEEGEITLINPENNGLIQPEEPLIFSWALIGTKGESYKIKIVEIEGNESPENAMLRNKAFFEKEGIRTTTFQLPKNIKLEKGNLFAWQVSIDNIKSEVITFSLSVDKFEVDNKNFKQWDVEFIGIGKSDEERIEWKYTKGNISEKSFKSRFINGSEIKGKIKNNIGSELPSQLLLINNSTKSKVSNSELNKNGEFSFKNLKPGVYHLQAETNIENLLLDIETDQKDQNAKDYLPFASQIVVINDNSDFVPGIVLRRACKNGYIRITKLTSDSIVTDWEYGKSYNRVSCGVFMNKPDFKDSILIVKFKETSEGNDGNKFTIKSDNAELVWEHIETSMSDPWCGLCKAWHNTTINCLAEDLIMTEANISVKIEGSKNSTGNVSLVNEKKQIIGETKINNGNFEFSDVPQGLYSFSFDSIQEISCLHFKNNASCQPKNVQFIISNVNPVSTEPPGIRLLKCNDNVLQLWEVSPSETRIICQVPFDCNKLCYFIGLSDKDLKYEVDSENKKLASSIISVLNGVDFKKLNEVDKKDNFEKIPKDEVKFITINPNLLSPEVLIKINFCWCNLCCDYHRCNYDCIDPRPTK